MAAGVSVLPKLSHRAYRAQLKKQRRKLKRQSIANARKELADNNVSSSSDPESNNEEEIERLRLHSLWLQREEAAQMEFENTKVQEEKKRRDREEQLRRMKEEIDNLSLKKFHKEATVQEVKSKLPEGNDGQWHNPIAPTRHEGQASQQEICQFFVKTGACRFGERCSRSHVRPTISAVLLIRGMFSHFSMEQAMTDDYDADTALEYEESETYQYFKDFYEDVLPEFQKCGKVVQLKVCCNHEPHLRGNVYVQFQSERQAEEAFKLFNGRFYGGKQLSCQFANISSWKSAICGLFHKNACPKGKNCNFLHVFKNPDNQFWNADRDFSVGSDRRFSSHRRRSPIRRSYSPPSRSRSRRQRRSPSSHKRKKKKRSRSRKRKRSSRHRDRHSPD